jgi:hypothetical protein
MRCFFGKMLRGFQSTALLFVHDTFVGSMKPTTSAVAARTLFDRIKQENKKEKKQIKLHETVYSVSAVHF